MRVRQSSERSIETQARFHRTAALLMHQWTPLPCRWCAEDIGEELLALRAVPYLGVVRGRSPPPLLLLPPPLLLPLSLPPPSPPLPLLPPSSKSPLPSPPLANPVGFAQVAAMGSYTCGSMAQAPLVARIVLDGRGRVCRCRHFSTKISRNFSFPALFSCECHQCYRDHQCHVPRQDIRGPPLV